MPPVKVLRAFEMRRDVANEALANNEWCEKEGKGGRGAKRVHTERCYASLRSQVQPRGRLLNFRVVCQIGSCTEIPAIFSIRTFFDV